MADSLPSQIISAIGGPDNVKSLTHCATRLRFELVDAGKVTVSGGSANSNGASLVTTSQEERMNDG